jgi:hypothetical protein
MAQPRSPGEVFLALVNGIAEGNPDGLPELYAEQTDVVHPFDPGEIVSSRDYHDHLASARAAGKLSELFAALSAAVVGVLGDFTSGARRGGRQDNQRRSALPACHCRPGRFCNFRIKATHVDKPVSFAVAGRS